MKFSGTVLSCFFFMSAWAIQIDGTITNNNKQGTFPQEVILRNFSLADGKSAGKTAVVSADGHYRFDFEPEQNGLYQIIIGQSGYNVFISTQEKQIRLTTDLNDKLKITIENSPENEAYKLYADFNSFYHPQFMSLFQNRYFENIDEELKSFYRDYFSGLQQVADKYPNSYTARTLVKAKIFAPLSEIQAQNDLRSFMKTRYLSNISWNNPEVLNDQTFDDCFMSYVAFILDTSFQSFREFYDKHFPVESGINTDIYKYAQARLFNYFMAANYETRLVYLLEKSLQDSRMEGSGTVYQMQTVNKVMPGNPFLPMTGVAQDGSAISLTDFVSKHKLSLLMFWAPDCSHCKESMPELKQLYDKYKTKGFGIYAVSIRNDKAKWEEVISEKQITWKNVLMQHEEGKIDDASAYFVTNTPTFVLIDKNGKIIRRYIGLNKLEEEIKNRL